jgi:hypothetical protein
VRAKGLALINRVMNLPEGDLFGVAFQKCTPVGAAERRNESGFLELDQQSPNHHRIRVHGPGETGRGAAFCLFQCEHRHHVHRKSKTAILHAMNVTKLITLAKRMWVRHFPIVLVVLRPRPFLRWLVQANLLAIAFSIQSSRIPTDHHLQSRTKDDDDWEMTSYSPRQSEMLTPDPLYGVVDGVLLACGEGDPEEEAEGDGDGLEDGEGFDRISSHVQSSPL